MNMDKVSISIGLLGALVLGFVFGIGAGAAMWQYISVGNGAEQYLREWTKG
jgi:hypothetical protein